MTHIKDDTQLAYYLQGYFELTGSTALNAPQARKIVSHILNMDTKGKVAQMVLAELAMNEKLEFTATLNDAGANISAALNDIFQHDIDPSYAGDQAVLQAVHGGPTHGRQTSRP